MLFLHSQVILARELGELGKLHFKPQLPRLTLVFKVNRAAMRIVARGIADSRNPFGLFHLASASILLIFLFLFLHVFKDTSDPAAAKLPSSVSLDLSSPAEVKDCVEEIKSRLQVLNLHFEHFIVCVYQRIILYCSCLCLRPFSTIVYLHQ